MATDKTVRIVELQAKVTGLDELTRAAASMNAASGAAKKAGTSFAQAGGAVQKGFSPQATNQIKNASYQFTDFAVQVQGGTDAMRAFGQQAPQLLAGFGAMGAVVGLVVSLMPAIIASFGEAEIKIEDASKSAELFRGAISDVKAIVSNTDMDDFAESFNKLDQNARKAAISLIETRLQLGKLMGQEEQQKLDDYAKSFGTFSIGFNKFGRDLNSASSGLTIAEKLGITREAGDEVANVLRGMTNGTLDQVGALEKLNSLNIQNNKTYNEFLGNIAKATKNTLEQKAAEEELLRIRDAAVGANGKNLVVQKEAIKAAKEAEQKRKEALRKEEEALRDAKKATDEWWASMINAAKQQEVLAAATQNFVAPLNDAEKAQLKVIENYKSVNEEVAKRVASADAELQRINQLTELLFDESAAVRDVAAAMLGLNELSAKAPKQVDEMGQAMKNLAAQGVGDFVDEIFEANRSFTDFAKSFIINITKMIAKQQILNALKGSSFGKALGFATGGAFGGATGLPHGIYNTPTFFDMPGGGPLRKFATGGVVGGQGVMGEAGPEAILPLGRGPSGDLGVKASLSVNVHNNVGAQVEVQQNGNDVDIFINKVAQDILRGGGKVAQSLERAYGMSRARGAI